MNPPAVIYHLLYIKILKDLPIRLTHSPFVPIQR